MGSVACIVSPSVAQHVHPLATLKNIAAEWQFKAFAQNQVTTDNEVTAALIDVNVLIVVGLLVLDSGPIVLAQYETSSERSIHTSNRLMRWSAQIAVVDS